MRFLQFLTASAFGIAIGTIIWLAFAWLMGGAR